ncbi:hypothetical protein [Oscillatoria sp. HE19RPO]|uniref:hypothetical protein n=1 Tax=Oscillatoria sp. HE19RPO TaxID=2954806 RepID=UPI0020C220BF|nr:hypothetical protein [Oscillatoria sp. HE19RPO]
MIYLLEHPKFSPMASSLWLKLVSIACKSTSGSVTTGTEAVGGLIFGDVIGLLILTLVGQQEGERGAIASLVVILIRSSFPELVWERTNWRNCLLVQG